MLPAGTLPDHTGDGPCTHTSAQRPPHESPAVNFTIVCSGPAPLRVTLLLPRKVIPPVRVYVPARSNTIPLPQAAMALLIAAAVALGSSVAQIAERLGTSP